MADDTEGYPEGDANSMETGGTRRLWWWFIGHGHNRGAPRRNHSLLLIGAVVIVAAGWLWWHPPASTTRTCKVSGAAVVTTSRPATAAGTRPRARREAPRLCPSSNDHVFVNDRARVEDAKTTTSSHPDALAGTVFLVGVVLLLLGGYSGRIDALTLPGGLGVNFSKEAEKAEHEVDRRAQASHLSPSSVERTKSLAVEVALPAAIQLSEFRRGDTAGAQPARVAAEYAIESTKSLRDLINDLGDDLDAAQREEALNVALDQLLRHQFVRAGGGGVRSPISLADLQTAAQVGVRRVRETL
jgi:hypothetical protein